MDGQKLEELLKDMSLEEKVGQLLQVTGDFFTEGAVVTGPEQDVPIPEEKSRLAGSVLGVMGAGKIREIQRAFMEQHPHHIPLLFMLDIINGYRTVFPVPLAQGAMFDPELARQCAGAAAREGSAAGLHVTFSPMADLVRDARWGRVMESTGEDVYLNSRYAQALVRGYQGEDLRSPGTLGACVKHFAGYGAPEGGREYNTAEISRHSFREYYLPAYESAVKAGSCMAMTSFNTVEGVPATVNEELLRGVLREEMGFDGVLISDYNAILETVAHGVAADGEDAAKKALLSGVDIDMMSGVYPAYLEKLVRQGSVGEELIDRSVRRVLELKNRLGLFEDPFRGADEEREKRELLSARNRALAGKAARESFVLLKNEGRLLPLKKGQKVALIGPYVDCREMMGSWSVTGRAQDVATLKEAASGQREGYDLTFCKGAKMLKNGVRLTGFDGFENPDVPESELGAWREEALLAAKEAGTVVMALGEHCLQSGEAASRGSLGIPENQEELFHAVCDVNPNVAVVLFSGRPLDISRIAGRAKAVLLAWMPGTEGGRAVWDVLTGGCNPSGKLPMSFPHSVGQVPVHYDCLRTGRPWDGESPRRYLSKYLDMPNEPLYPFGYGLSYTSFSVSPVSLSGTQMGPDETIEARVRVKNTGPAAGAEVVQMYIRDVTASVARPDRQLKGFQRVTLAPGEEREVCFSIGREELEFITAAGKRECEPGEFEVMIGGDSRTDNRAAFELRGEA